MRRLNRKKALKVVKELDAFPKVPESYQEKTGSGGTCQTIEILLGRLCEVTSSAVSLLTFTIIAVLVISEFMYYRSVWYKYEYEVDSDIENDLMFNIDMVVAMKCAYVGADLLDLSGTTHMTVEGKGFQTTDTFFEMTEAQRQWLKKRKELLELHEEWRSLKDEQIDNYRLVHTPMPNRLVSDVPGGKQPDACRVYGSMNIKKIAGNFHITAGKAIPHPRGHAHMSAMVATQDLNFSHRISHLSFGNAAVGTFNPLDGEVKLTTHNTQMYQYFIQVVPTSFSFAGGVSYSANQYSVTHRERIIDHSGGSHGIPGVFMKYDVSALTVSIKQQQHSIGRFLVRICGIVGGIFATSGLLHSFIGFLFDIIFCRKKEMTGSASPGLTRASNKYLNTDPASLTTDMGAASSDRVTVTTAEQ